MTNDEIRMTKEIRNPKPEALAMGFHSVEADLWELCGGTLPGEIRISSFGFYSTFVIRHSDFPPSLA